MQNGAGHHHFGVLGGSRLGTAFLAYRAPFWRKSLGSMKEKLKGQAGLRRLSWFTQHPEVVVLVLCKGAKHTGGKVSQAGSLSIGFLPLEAANP